MIPPTKPKMLSNVDDKMMNFKKKKDGLVVAFSWNLFQEKKPASVMIKERKELNQEVNILYICVLNPITDMKRCMMNVVRISIRNFWPTRHVNIKRKP